MPRRRHRREGGADDDGEKPDVEARMERIVVFEKTKMCKFHIMGICTKGDGCRFAHERMQLQTLPDLSCTKLCKTLIATGVCNNEACRYAHNREQLKGMPDPSTKAPLVSADAAPSQQMFGQQAAMVSPAPQLVQATGSGAAVVAGAAGPCGLMIGQSMPQALMTGQGPFNTSVMSAAIMQIGQAAQAHAAEAARLQQMAATLHDGSQQMPATAAPFFIQGGVAAFGVAGPQQAAMAYSAPPGQALPGTGSRGGAAGLAAKPRSPLQIAKLVEEGGPSACAPLAAGAPVTMPAMGDNTYGRQESSGTGSTTAGTEQGGWGYQDASMDAADEGGGPRVPAYGTVDGHDLGGNLGVSGMTVKNTFLDFDVSPSGSALRSVQTAGGRLDIMASSLDA